MPKITLIKAFIFCSLLIINTLSTKAVPFFQTDSLKAASVDTLVPDTVHVESFLEAPVHRSAEDSIVADWVNGKIYLYGNAVIEYQDITLKADLIIYDTDNSIITATYSQDSIGNPIGKPVFSEKEEEINADTIFYNFDTKRGVIKNVRTQVAEGYIDGDLVIKDENDVLYIQDGRYCPCEEPDAATKFRVSRIKVMKDLIVTGPGYLELADIPTPVLFPFGFFPNEKKRNAGILIPAPGNAGPQGFFLQGGGFYWPVNDYMDMTFKGDIYSRGSFGLYQLTQYTKRYKYDGNIEAQYFVSKTSDPEFPDYSETRDFWIQWKHFQDPKASPYNRFSTDVRLGSQNFFRNNFNVVPGDYLSNQFNSNINYTRLFPGKPFTLALSANHNQNTDNGNVNVTLPQATFAVNRVYPARLFNLNGTKRGKFRKQLERIGLTYTLQGKNEAQLQDSLIALNNMDYVFDQMKNGISHTTTMNTSLKFWKGRISLNPSTSYTGRMYFEKQERSWDTTDQEVDIDTVDGVFYNHNYNFSANLTTKVFGFYKFKGPKKRIIRHMMTPNIGFTYRPDFSTLEDIVDRSNNDSLIGTYSPFAGAVYGFSPGGASGSLTFRLNNTVDMKMNNVLDSTGEAKKSQLIDNFNISGSYDFMRDSLNLNDIVVSMATTLFKNIIINYSSTYDPYLYNDRGEKLDIFSLPANGKIARLKDARLGLGVRLSSDRNSTNMSDADKDELRSRNQDPFDYYDVPWSFNINYNINYNRAFYQRVDAIDFDTTFIDSATFVQTIGLNGDWRLSENWRFTLSTNYDLQAKAFSFTMITIERDLNCWTASFNWIPLGERRRYVLTIALKNPLLRDAKYTRQRNWFDQKFF